MKTVIILRGTSGCGKSTFANLIAEPKIICTADDYFCDDQGNYNFDATKLGHAHNACAKKFDAALYNATITNIVVANTNCKPSDYNYYVDAAKKAGANVTFVILEKRHDNDNVHGVPNFVLERQADNLRKDIKLS